jgi:large repetitive protein
LFTLKLRATKDQSLSQVLNITSRLTAQEAYGQGDEVMDLKLEFNKTIASDHARLDQNQPNPFAEETLIGFYLPKAAQATLTIRDVKGALVYRTQGDYSKGMNQVKLGKQDLKAAGVLYYTLETDDFTATKKMVIMTR